MTPRVRPSQRLYCPVCGQRVLPHTGWSAPNMKGRLRAHTVPGDAGTTSHERCPGSGQVGCLEPPAQPERP